MVVVVFDSMPGRTCQNEISNNRLLVRYRSLRALVTLFLLSSIFPPLYTDTRT